MCRMAVFQGLHLQVLVVSHQYNANVLGLVAIQDGFVVAVGALVLVGEPAAAGDESGETQAAFAVGKIDGHGLDGRFRQQLEVHSENGINSTLRNLTEKWVLLNK